MISEGVVAAVARGCACLFTWSLASTSLASASLAMAQGIRPNVLVVLFDDVGFMDFGAYGSDSRTPNIDSLAKRGVMLSRFHSSPFCGPKLSGLLPLQADTAATTAIFALIPPSSNNSDAASNAASSD